MEHEMTSSIASDQVFTYWHILGTAAVTAALAAAAAFWRLGRNAWIDILGVTIAAGASVFLWRTSANMPQLNADGLSPFSANDWLAPVLTYVFLSVYAAARPRPTSAASARPGPWPCWRPWPSTSSPSEPLEPEPDRPKPPTRSRPWGEPTGPEQASRWTSPAARPVPTWSTAA